MRLLEAAGWQVEWHETLASTNDRAIAAAEAGEPPGLVVMAAEQTAGRGRLGRAWTSPRGNLHCSVLLNPDALPRGGTTSLLAGLAAHEALAPHVPPPHALHLKWPNDLLVGGAKIGGVLVEAGTTGDGRAWLVAGIGMNLAAHPALPDRPTTSLPILGAAPVPASAMAEALLAALGRWLGVLSKGGMAPILAAWSERALPLGSVISVKAGETTLRGRYGGLDDDGALLLALEAGGTRRVLAGEVFAEG